MTRKQMLQAMEDEGWFHELDENSSYEEVQ